MKIKSFLGKFVRSKKFKYSILTMAGLILGLIFIGGLSVMRYSQLCSYQTAVNSGQLKVQDGVNLCPNLADSDDWLTIVSNTFNQNVFASLSLGEGKVNNDQASSCTDQLNPICWLQNSNSKLRSKDGFTNLLIAGIDSSGSGKRTSLKNTDSMMLVSYDNSSGNSLLISFPRDLVVRFRSSGGGYHNTKMNAIYAFYGNDSFISAVEQITGRPIHYHVYLNLDTFIEAVNKFGKITIDLDESFADVYPCSEVPKNRKCPEPRFVEDGMYGLFRFPKGKNTFDSFDAVVYSRARKYSSDYKRAARQQKLARAVLKTALSSSKPLGERIQNYLDLYNTFKTKVSTNVELKDIAAALSLMDKVSDKVARIVVDPNLNGGSIIGSEAGQPTFRDKSYATFQNYIADIWKYLPYYIEKPKFLVINKTGKDIPSNSALGKWLAQSNPFRKVKITKTAQDPNSNGITKIYDFRKGAKTGSLREINTVLKGSLIYSATIDEMKRSGYQEDILIVYEGEPLAGN